MSNGVRSFWIGLLCGMFGVSVWLVDTSDVAAKKQVRLVQKRASQVTHTRRKKIILRKFEIFGKRQLPRAYYILHRSNAKYKTRAMRPKGLIKKLVNSVKTGPF